MLEFHISRSAREKYHFNEILFSLSGNVIFANFQAVRQFAYQMNLGHQRGDKTDRSIKAGDLNAMGMIDEILHLVVSLYRKEIDPSISDKAVRFIIKQIGDASFNTTLLRFTEEFPPNVVFREHAEPKEYLKGHQGDRSNRDIVLEEMLLLWLANVNPAFSPFKDLFSDEHLRKETSYLLIIDNLFNFFDKQPAFGPDRQNLISMLRSPAIAEPYSLQGQLEYIQKRWGQLLGDYLKRIIGCLDLLSEEEKVFIPGGPGPSRVPQFNLSESEIVNFSQDSDWMPNCVLIAKNTFVWLDQLSRKYQREIKRLDQVPDEELERLAQIGMTGLWLIGLWKRSNASQRIKQLCGNQDAVASAYSLAAYSIADDLGGDAALDNLRDRAMRYGIRLASDMVPNHMGLDSNWVLEHPDWFLALDYSPFPSYRFSGPDLSSNGRIALFLEDHYYTKNDAAVVFKRVDHSSGQEKYIYHGNDGTNMPWNDTAQLNYLNPQVRETVIQTILAVAKRFPIIRFDAAMTLAKKHYQRLWFPEPGNGGAIPSRVDHSLTKEQFDRQMPKEFWREVVDRVAREVPNTLLLAEAFWMMEGYFVRTLGMHRVYNSAFMNMLRDEQNAEYRQVIKNTLEFDPQILKRYVNFMNNPDEKTAVEQFGKGNKYFGICTMMATLPGLPMFGHGQFEGFSEKYGMEYRKATLDETVDEDLTERHRREISPLLHHRWLFSGVDNFLLFDFYQNNGKVNEDVFAYANCNGNAHGLVVYNNRAAEARGWIKQSSAYARKHGSGKKLIQKSVAEGLALHHSASRYVIFRDQSDGFEYLRSCQQIHNEGIYFELEAYQTKVLLDFREVTSSAKNDYAKLEKELNGRGVPSIEEALIEHELLPILAPFSAMICPENLKLFSIQSSGQKHKRPILSFQGDYKQHVNEFLIAISRRLGKTNDPKTLVDRVLKQSLFLLDLPHFSQKHYFPSSNQTKPAINYFSTAPGEKIEVLLGAFLWITLSPLIQIAYSSKYQGGIRNLLGELHLTNVMQQNLSESGLDSITIRRTMDLVDGMLVLFENTGKWKHLSSLFNLAFTDPSLSRYLNVNSYHDIQWFEQESFEQFTWILGITKWIERIDINSDENELIERLIQVYSVIRIIRRAKNRSLFQTEKYLKEIEKSSITFV